MDGGMSGWLLPLFSLRSQSRYLLDIAERRHQLMPVAEECDRFYEAYRIPLCIARWPNWPPLRDVAVAASRREAITARPGKPATGHRTKPRRWEILGVACRD
jgi:hypothetical protein